MTTYGLTPAGFTPKPLEAIREAIASSLRSAYGSGFDTSPSSRAGVLIDNIAKQFAESWEAHQLNYDALDPDNAEGIALDAILAYSGLTRQPALPSTAPMLLVGTNGSVIPDSRIVSYQANQFGTDASVTLDEALTTYEFEALETPNGAVITVTVTVDAVPHVFSYIAGPDSTPADCHQSLVDQANSSNVGIYGVTDGLTALFISTQTGAVFSGASTASISYSILGGSTDVPAPPGTGEGFVWVAGDQTTTFTTGVSFTITGGPNAGSYAVASPGASFDGAKTIIPVGVTTIVNSPVGTIDIALTFNETTDTTHSKQVQASSLETGQVQGPLFAINVIEVGATGLDYAFNTSAAILGRDLEGEIDARIRRAESVTNLGSTNLDAIRAKVRNVTGVVQVQGYENTDLVTDGFGQPGKSIWIIVQGGQDQDIAEAIYLAKAAGIQAYGTEGPFTVIDSEGAPKVIDFSRPTNVPIFLEYVITLDPEQGAYPTDGDDLIKEFAESFGDENFQIGQDVAPWKLIGAIAPVPGIGTVELRLSRTGAPGPGDTGQIVIDRDEKADFDVANIVVTVV